MHIHVSKFLLWFFPLFILGLNACTSSDPLFKVFAQVDDGFTSGDACNTVCTVSVFNSLAKPSPILQASATTPQGCDGNFNLRNQTWQVGEFDIGQSNICAQFATNNPTEIICEVVEDDVVVHTYLATGEFPFVPQGCDRAGLDLTLIADNLLTFSPDQLAGYSCETLEIAYEDNACAPGDNSKPVCQTLNDLVSGGFTDCPLGAS